MDPHCRIGRVQLKGARNIASRLPRKALGVYLQLKAAADAQRKPGGS